MTKCKRCDQPARIAFIDDNGQVGTALCVGCMVKEATRLIERQKEEKHGKESGSK
jgi:hypothetical protein